MPKQADRVPMETKAFPPPPHKVGLGFQREGDAKPLYPENIGLDDVFITIVDVKPKHEVSS